MTGSSPLHARAARPPHQPAGGRGGQSTVELGLLVGIVVASLVIMSLYARRAYQSYLYNTASAQGRQFDPSQPRAESQQLNQFVQTQDITVTSGPTIPGALGGYLPGRILNTRVSVETNWNVSRTSSHEAQ